MKQNLLITAALSLGLCGAMFAPAAAFADDTNEGPAIFKHIGADLFAGYDYWHGFPDGTFPGNNGGHVGANLGVLLVPECGVGLQAGGSYGRYDFNGRDSTVAQRPQEQTFFTGGLYYRGPEGSIVSGGLVYDFMLNHNFGVIAGDSYLQQLRGQLAVKVYGEHELGVWGAMELNRASAFAPGIAVSYRGIDQASIFYHYTFANGADARLWLGLPFSRGLAVPHHDVGTWLVGGRAAMPFNDYLSLVAEASYMSPHTSSLNLPLKVNEVTSLTIGLNWSLGGKAQSRSSAYMPVANNNTFFVDGNTTF